MIRAMVGTGSNQDPLEPRDQPRWGWVVAFLLVVSVALFALAIAHDQPPRMLSDDPVALASFEAHACGGGPMPSLPPNTIINVAVDCNAA